MASLKDIRRRIKSVKGTSKITRAMQLVAAAKMKKAQDQAVAGREYAQKLNQILGQIIDKSDGDLKHAFLGNTSTDQEAKRLVVIISTDKGLCGGLNSNLLKKLLRDQAESSIPTNYLTIGKKVGAKLVSENSEIIKSYTLADPTVFSEAAEVATQLTELFLGGEYTQIEIAYNVFESAMVQTPSIQPLLPLAVEDLLEATSTEEPSDEVLSYLFEPGLTAVLEDIMPLYINFQVYQKLVESKASEHSARMIAMKSATDNAKDIVDDLQLQYNKARQAAITSELLEITTAQMALD